MDLPEVVARVTDELRAIGTQDRAEQEKRYLKSDLTHFGVPLPAIRKVAATAVRTKPTHQELLSLAGSLWTASPPIHELRMAAIEILIKRVSALGTTDLPFVERLIRDSASWAYVDALAEKVVGALLIREPALTQTLDAWVTDPYMWIRRTAVLALLPGIRAGEPDLDRLSRYGDTLISEREFFIRKALGWALRELSKRDPAWVRTWVAARTDVISGVTIREAARHLPTPAKEALLTAYKTR